MPSQAAKITAVALSATLLFAGCKDSKPADAISEPATTETAGAQTSPSADAAGDGAGGGTGDGAADAPVAEELDTGALQEKRDPERLLRYYANAVRGGQWWAAARAWSLDAQMTPQKLEAEFGGDAGPTIAIGKGDAGEAAGSLYYEAPIVITFANEREARRGTVVLRRANDVPGASAEQLVWRIERSSTVPQ